MDMRIELVFVPVSDVDRAKAFYVDKVGFVADFDETPYAGLRFVQLTPPSSACSIAIGTGLTQMTPGEFHAIQVVVEDADAALEQLRSNGVEAQGVDEQSWGRFVTFADPDGNRWTLQQLPARG